MGTSVNTTINKQSSELINKHLSSFQSYIKNKYQTNIKGEQQGENTLNLEIYNSKTGSINLQQTLLQEQIIQVLNTVEQSVSQQNTDQLKQKVKDDILQQAKTEAKLLGISVSTNVNTTEKKVINETVQTMISTLESTMESNFSNIQQLKNVMNIKIIDSVVDNIQANQTNTQKSSVVSEQKQKDEVKEQNKKEQETDNQNVVDNKTETSAGISNGMMAIIGIIAIAIVFIVITNARKTAVDPNLAKNLEQAAKFMPQGQLAGIMKGGLLGGGLSEVLSGPWMLKFLIYVQTMIVIGLLIVWFIIYLKDKRGDAFRQSVD